MVSLQYKDLDLERLGSGLKDIGIVTHIIKKCCLKNDNHPNICLSNSLDRVLPAIKTQH